MTEDSLLSKRELEILRLVATGASNKEIAAELYISVNTVKVHLRNIYGKLDVSSRTEATIYAVREGLVPSPRSDAEPETVPSNEVASLPESIPSNAAPAKDRWLKWGVAGAILLVLLVTAGLVGAQWSRRQAAPASPVAVDAQSFEQDRWRELAPMLIARASFAASVFDNHIYAMGGETPEGITAAAERYDIAADTWTPIAEMPEPLMDIQGATIGGKIYVPGGRRADDSVADHLLVYDPRSDTWDTRTPMPVPLSAYALVAFEGKLYLFGGWDGEQYTDAALRYDPSLDAWESLPPLPTARGYAGAAVSGGKIHVIGGYDGEQALDSMYVFSQNVDSIVEGNPWQVVSPLPEECYAMGTATVADTIYVVGGEGNAREFFQMEYSPLENSWQFFGQTLVSSWTQLNAIPVGSQIYILGGRLDSHITARNFQYQAIYIVLIPIVR